MNTPQCESPLWTWVLVLSEAMDDPECSREKIIGILRGLEEGFADSTDPVEQFSEFAALRLCRSFERLLVQLISD